MAVKTKATKAQVDAVSALRESLKVLHGRVNNMSGVKNASKELLQRRTDVFAIGKAEVQLDITASKGKSSHDKYWEFVAEHGKADSVVMLTAALIAPLMSEIPLRGLYLLTAMSDQVDIIVGALKALDISFPKGVKSFKYLTALVLAAEIQVMSSNPEFESALDIFKRGDSDVMSIDEASILDFEVD